jgi:hypothetical protein
MIACARATPAGCFVEVGVYQGGSAWHLYDLALEQERELYLYDTFTGIPYHDAIDSHHIGDFSDCSYLSVVERFPHAAVVPGVFPMSAIDMPRIAFAHLDCDQYRSVKESATYLRYLMVPGGVMWFDDSPCLAGAHRAVLELFGDKVKISSAHGKHYVRF